MQKQDRISSKPKGRQGPNCERASMDDLLACFRDLCVMHGVNFPFKESYLNLLKTMLLFAPAFVIASGLPVSLYGVGTFKLHKSSKGKVRLKMRYSSTINNFLDSYAGGEFSKKEVYKILNRLLSIERKDTSVMEVNK